MEGQYLSSGLSLKVVVLILLGVHKLKLESLDSIQRSWMNLIAVRTMFMDCFDAMERRR
jgi:hypothetical protein